MEGSLLYGSYRAPLTEFGADLRQVYSLYEHEDCMKMVVPLNSGSL